MEICNRTIGAKIEDLSGCALDLVGSQKIPMFRDAVTAKKIPMES